MEVDGFESLLLSIHRTETETKDADFISSLPIEIVQKIFDYLDAPSLLAAARVNDNCRNIIESSVKLKGTLREGLLIEKMTEEDEKIKEEESIFLKIAVCYLFFLVVTYVIAEVVNVCSK